MSKTIYLSGNMTPDPDIYYDWVKRFTSNEHLDMYKFSHATDTFNDSQFIVHHDLARLKHSDILVANVGVLNASHHLTGLVVEIYEAYKQNKPVYTFVSDDLIISEQAKSPWLRQFITKEFSSEEELVAYLIFDENL
jgi:nucleoside 2-deoxyribosyltransferase